MLAETSEVFAAFVRRMETLMEASRGDEARLIVEGQQLLAQLVASEAWLPAEYMQTDLKQYRQYLLHRDTLKGFTVLSVAWGAGQYATPHNHKVWGLIGQLRGAELTRTYEDPRPGEPLTLQSSRVLRPGETTAVSPSIGDVHDVRNVGEGDSVSIHVYGGDLAGLARLRNRFDVETGAVTPFVTQYH